MRRYKQRRAKYMSVAERNNRIKHLLDTEPYICGIGDLRDAIHFLYGKEIARFNGPRGDTHENEIGPRHIKKVGLRFMRYELFPVKPITYWCKGRHQILFINEREIKRFDNIRRKPEEKHIAVLIDLLKNPYIALTLIGIENPNFDIPIFGIKGNLNDIISNMKNDLEGPTDRFDSSDPDNPYFGPSNETISTYERIFSVKDFLAWAEKQTTSDMKSDPRRHYQLIWVRNLGRKYTNREQLMEYLRDKAHQLLQDFERVKIAKRMEQQTKRKLIKSDIKKFNG